MAKYYGVTRSSEYLAHYGVKGMKWGVRKALDYHDTAALTRHYRKAQKKLAKLTARAEGKGIAARRVGAGAATSALLSGAGTYAINRLSGVDPLNSAKTAGLAALAGGAGGAVLNAGRASAAEKARAREKRDEWKREMDRTFRGTGVGKNGKAQMPRVQNNKRAKQNASDYARKMNKNLAVGQLIGGPVGQAIAMNRMIKDDPKGYANFKRQFKNMTPKQRMKAMYGRG